MSGYSPRAERNEGWLLPRGVRTHGWRSLQQIRPVLAGAGEGVFLLPGLDISVVAGKQHLGHAEATELDRPGVGRSFQALGIGKRFVHAASVRRRAHLAAGGSRHRRAPRRPARRWSEYNRRWKFPHPPRPRSPGGPPLRNGRKGSTDGSRWPARGPRPV